MSVDPNHASVAGDALSGSCSFANEELPSPLPVEPFAMFRAWMDEAHSKKSQPNPNAMTLCTVDPNGKPSGRVVLCRMVDAGGNYIVFFTNYDSRKGEGLEHHGYASVVFHWDHLDRQVRMEGRIVRSPAAESDAYFARRPVMSRVAAWASEQSRPIASRADLMARNAEAERRFGIVRTGDGDDGVTVPKDIVVPRPPNWGGYRLWPEHVELWLGHSWRLHDRARWSRTLTVSRGAAGEDVLAAGAWRVTRLQP